VYSKSRFNGHNKATQSHAHAGHVTAGFHPNAQAFHMGTMVPSFCILHIWFENSIKMVQAPSFSVISELNVNVLMPSNQNHRGFTLWHELSIHSAHLPQFSRHSSAQISFYTTNHRLSVTFHKMYFPPNFLSTFKTLKLKKFHWFLNWKHFYGFKGIY